jgi:hypothetical protein
MRRHNEGGQFTATARGGASAGAQGNTEVEERLDGGGRHDVWAYHGVRQLIPRRGPVRRPGPSSCQTRPSIRESAAGTPPPPMGRLLGTSYRDLPKRSAAVALRVVRPDKAPYGSAPRVRSRRRSPTHQTNPDSGVIAEVIVGGARNARAERGRSRRDAGHRSGSRCWRRGVGRRCIPRMGVGDKPDRRASRKRCSRNVRSGCRPQRRVDVEFGLSDAAVSPRPLLTRAWW